VKGGKKIEAKSLEAFRLQGIDRKRMIEGRHALRQRVTGGSQQYGRLDIQGFGNGGDLRVAGAGNPQLPTAHGLLGTSQEPRKVRLLGETRLGAKVG
jgi:hypothetical protein